MTIDGQSQPAPPSTEEINAKPTRLIRELPRRGQTGRPTKVTISWNQFGLKSTCVVNSEVLENRGQKRSYEDDSSDEDKEDIDDRPRKKVARKESVARVAQWLGTSSIAAGGVQPGGASHDIGDPGHSPTHFEEAMEVAGPVEDSTEPQTESVSDIPMRGEQAVVDAWMEVLSRRRAECHDGDEESAPANDERPEGSSSGLHHSEPSIHHSEASVHHSEASIHHSEGSFNEVSAGPLAPSAQSPVPRRHEHSNYDGDSDDSPEVHVNGVNSLPSDDKGKQREPPPCSPSWDRLEETGPTGSTDAPTESSPDVKKYAYDELNADNVAQESTSNHIAPTIHHPTPLRPEDTYSPPKLVCPRLEPLTMEKIRRLYPHTRRSEGRVHRVTEDRIARPKAPPPAQYQYARQNYLESKVAIKDARANVDEPPISIEDIVRLTSKCAVTDSAVKDGRRPRNQARSVTFGSTTIWCFHETDRPRFVTKRSPLEVPTTTASIEDIPGERRTGKKLPEQLAEERAEKQTEARAEATRVAAASSSRQTMEPGAMPLAGPSASSRPAPVAGSSAPTSSTSTSSRPSPQIPQSATHTPGADSSRAAEHTELEQDVSATAPPVPTFDLSTLQDALPPSMAPVVEPPPTTSACPPSVEIQVANERAPVPPTAPSTSTSTLVGESSTPSVSVPQGGDHSPSGGLGATALSQPQASTSSWQEAPSRASSLSAECYADGSFGVLPDIQTNFEVPHSQAIPTPLDAIPNVSAQVHETQHPMPFDTTATALQQTQSSWQGGVYAQPSFLSQGDNVDASMARIIAQSGIDPEAFSQWSEENLVGSFRHIMNTGVAHEGVELPHMVPTESYEGQGSFGQQVPPQQQPNILQPPANMDGQGVPQFLGAGTTAESSDPFAWLEGTGAIFCRTATTPSGDEYCMAVNAAVLNELAWSIALDAQQSLPPAKLAVFYALPLEMQLAICNWDGSLPLALPEGDAVVAWTYSPEMPHLSTSYTSPAFQQEPAPSSISADVKTDPDAFSFNLDSQEDLDAAIRASLEEVLGGTVAGASAFVEEQDEIMSGPSPPPEEPPAYAEEPHLAAPAEEAKPAVEDLFPASQEPPRAEHSTIPSVPEAAPEVPPRAEGLSADDAPAASAEASAQPSPPQSAQSAPPVHTNGAQTDAQPRATSTIASLSLDDITLAVVELYVRLEYAHCTRPEVFISEDLCFVPESAARARKLDSEARRRLLSPLHAERLMCEAVQRVQAVH